MTQPTVKVQVTQRYQASADDVFAAWLDPAILGRWMFGPEVREETIVRLTLDPRVGGAFSFVVRRQEQEIDHVGNYLEIDPPRRLVFTWGIAENLPETSRVVVEITPVATGCELTLTHEMDPKWSDFSARVSQGWTTMLAALAKVVNAH